MEYVGGLGWPGYDGAYITGFGLGWHVNIDNDTCGRIVVDMTDSLAHSSICYYNRKVDDNTMH
jgi:hypothetical protein